MEPVPVQALEIVELQVPLSPVHVLEPAAPEEHMATPPTANTAALEPGTTQDIATGTNSKFNSVGSYIQTFYFAV